MYSAAIKRRVLDMACHGVSYYEIERTLGVSHATVSKWARAAGIKRGKGGGCVASNNAKRNAEALERVRSELAGRFEVLSLRASRLANLRCCVCGHEFERSVDVRYETTCPECARRIVEENERRRIREHDEHMKASTIVRGFRRFLRYKQNEEQFNQWLDEPHACKECGRTFTMRELREDNPWNFSYKPTFCSKACSNKWNRRNTGYKRRQSIGTSHGISLSKLIRRDNNTCYICGGACDDSDYEIRGNSFIAGPTYPSVDHVVPLSKGGTNDISNARLAHCFCNSIKGDRSIEWARDEVFKRHPTGFPLSPGRFRRARGHSANLHTNH